MKAEDLLFSQGFGTRYDCRAMIVNGHLSISGKLFDDPDADVEIEEGQEFFIDGTPWKFFEKVIIVMNKPEHFECSLKPTAYPSVSTLLPAPFRKRGLQPVGRLDEDTTGLLIFTDDGKLNHRLTHPKRKVQKIYEVTLKYPATEEFKKKLLEGVLLSQEKEKVRAENLEEINPTTIHLTISQGKYHQVKRMVAAASNRVTALKRIQFGKLKLPEDLPLGKWDWISGPQEIC